MRFSRMHPRRVATAALLLALAAASLAAPVFSTDDDDITAPDAEAVAASIPSTSRTVTRSGGVIGVPEGSAGNKSFDLLLDFQGRPGDQLQRKASPASPAAEAATAEPRAEAAQRPAPDNGANTPELLPFESMADARHAQPPERREWTGWPVAAGGGTGYPDGSRQSASSRDRYDENPVRHLPREVLLFLRENRYWLLGGLALFGVIGAGLKAYSRRI